MEVAPSVSNTEIDFPKLKIEGIRDMSRTTSLQSWQKMFHIDSHESALSIKTCTSLDRVETDNHQGLLWVESGH